MNKDKIIEVMKHAHQDALCNADATVDEAWECALQALLQQLPEVIDTYETEPEFARPDGTFSPLSPMKTVLKGDSGTELYKQLLEMKNEGLAR